MTEQPHPTAGPDPAGPSDHRAGGAAPEPARPGARRRWPAYLFAVLFALGVALLAGRLGDRLASDVNASVRTYRIIDATAVEITVKVRRDPTRDALCLLRSRDRDRAEVGHFDLRIPADPGGPNEVVATGTVTTTGQGVTGEVGSCLALTPGAPPPFEDHQSPPPANPALPQSAPAAPGPSSVS